MPPRGRVTGRPGRPGGPGSKPPRSADRPAASGGPTAGDLAAHRARLHAIIEPVAAAAGYDLEDLAVQRMGRRFVLRVTIDRDGGVALDAVADLARQISVAIDAAEESAGEFIAGEYQLEVSSPGVDRPLVEPRHWRRNVGRLVKVKIGAHTIRGRVVAADDAGVTFDIAGTRTTTEYSDLGTGRVEIEFSRLDEIDEEDMVEFVDDESNEDEEDDGES